MSVFDKAPARFKKVETAKSGNLLVTGRLMYANLFTAARPSKNETDEKKFQYGATMLIPAGFDMSELNAKIQALFEENVPVSKRAGYKWKNPIKSTADEGTLAAYAEDYPYMIRFNSKKYDRNGKERPAPDVVKPSNGAIVAVPAADDPTEVYNGRWAQASVNPYWYNNETNGVSLGMANVLLLWNDEPLAGGKVSASSEFEAVDDVDFGEDGGIE